MEMLRADVFHSDTDTAASSVRLFCPLVKTVYGNAGYQMEGLKHSLAVERQKEIGGLVCVEISSVQPQEDSILITGSFQWF